MQTKTTFVCPCTSLEDLLDQPGPPNPHSTRQFPLEWLYFCPQCHLIQCPECIHQVTASRYCPQCLKEVSKKDARDSGNKCMRYCFRCPACTAPGVAVQELPAAAQGSKEQYQLICQNPGCALKWKSDPETLVLRKSSKYYLCEQAFLCKNRASIARFEVLCEMYENQQFEDDFTEALDLDLQTSKPMIYPLFVSLESKKTSKCRSCGCVLCKPEASVRATYYEELNMAVDYLPSFVLSHRDINNVTEKDNMDDLGESSARSLCLTVTNPLDCPIEVTISSPSSDMLTIPSPSVELGPSSSRVDSVSIVKGVPSFYVSRETDASRKVRMEGLRQLAPEAGVIEKGANWAALSLVVSEKQVQKQSDIPIFIRMNYKQGSEAVELSFWVILKNSPED